MRIRHRVFVAMALLGVAILGVAGGGQPPGATAKAAACPRAQAATPAATMTAVPTPATPLAVPSAQPMNRPAAFGPLQLTVTGVEGLRCVAGPETMRPAGVFLAVTLQVVANGSVAGEGEFPVGELRVADRRGEALEPALAATAALAHQRGLPIPMLSPLTLGAPTTEIVVFDVPRTATDLVLTSSDGAFAIRLARSAASLPGG